MFLIVLAPITQTACGKNDQRKFINGLSACFLGLDKVSDLLQAENQAGRLSNESELAIRDELARVSERIDTLENRIEALNEITANDRVQLGELLDAVLSDLDRLNNAYALGFKNTEARAEFSKWIKSARGGLAIVRTIMGAFKGSVPAQPLTQAIKQAKGGSK